MPDKPDPLDKVKWERVEPVARRGKWAGWEVALDRNRLSSKRLERFAKGAAWVLVCCLAAFGTLCAFVLAIAQHHISRSPDMRFHVGHFWHRWWSAFTAAVGSNSQGFTLTFLEPLVAFITSFLALLLFVGWRAMKQDKLKAIIAAFALTFTVQVILFGPTFTRKGIDTVYQDRQSLVKAVTALTANNAQLRSENSRLANSDIGNKVAQAQADVQAERDNARRWREAYEETTKGDLHPDRNLDSEDRRRLREMLERIAKDPRNKDYIKLDFGMNTNPETQHIGWQVYTIFKESHWSLPPKIKTEPPKGIEDQLQVYGGRSYASGIFIFTDDPQNRGRYLSSMLNSCCGLQVLVNPRGVPQNFKGTLLWIGNKQFTNWKDND
jgi:hypothetical protein